jgi:hypothetical protein
VKKGIAGILLAFFLIIFLFIGWGTTVAQVDDNRSFPETGHWVSGEFLRFYESIPNPEQIYGYPITDAFQSNLSHDPDGTLIQYFERARFELHPENPDELRVVLTPLGEYYYDLEGPGHPVLNPTSPSACRAVPDGGLQVCYSFLRFFDAQGGIARFGYPVSEMIRQNGRVVQYFQRARFEWRPELPAGQQVILTDLGRQYFYHLGEDTRLLQPSQDALLAEPLELQVHAFVERSVMPPNGLQQVYVIVQNQTLTPVPGAQVVIQIQLPSGEVQDFSMPLTDSNGVSGVSFIVQDEPSGLVQVYVRVRTNQLDVNTVTSFRIWK